jgi:uncharacterized membrane protein YhaH (DUF805 family)
LQNCVSEPLDHLKLIVTQSLSQLFSFHGRLPLGRYWLLSFAVLAAMVPALVVSQEFINVPSPLAWVLVALFFGVPTWLLTASQVRRLHDRSLSGGWVFATMLMLAVGFFLREAGGSPLWMVFALMSTLSGLYLFFQTMRRGEAGENEYGPDPLALAAKSVHEPNKPEAVPSPANLLLEDDWAAAAVEFGSQRRPGLWAQCFSQAQGDSARAEALYLKFRAQELAQCRG